MTIEITETCKYILSKSNLGHSNILYIPKISDTEYDKIKYVIEFIGGHWSERCKGFIMDDTSDNVINKIKRVLTLDKINISSQDVFKIKNQFYPTPSWLAKDMVERANISYSDKFNILEPSAGKGAILQYIVQYTASKYTAVELSKQNVEYLRKLGYKVNNTSFENYALNTNKKFDRVIMNPPFANEMDLRHTALAFNLLKEGGKLVGLVAENSLYYARPITTMFNGQLSNLDAKLTNIQHGAFIESGTSVDITMIEVVKHSEHEKIML